MLAQDPTLADPKPKLLFIRPIADNLPQFVHLHLREHVKCLSQFFDVTLLTDDNIDYKFACELHKPAIVLFESGVYSKHLRLSLPRNIDAYPEIPRLGLCNADAYCQSRERFLSDMFLYGVNTFFTISVSMPAYTPDIADQLFVWPNFADPELYRNYGESKAIPLLFTGSMACHYPWRNQIYKQASRHYPSLTCPHLGWFSNHATQRMICDERYARLLNASLIVPACGTIANEAVRKHFEIPACMACLVAERTPALDAAGFVDMTNCVFADANDITDKLDYLFTNRDILATITLEGHKLVNSRHTLRHRDQIYQWFSLNRSLSAGEKIVQLGPFQGLTVVPKFSSLTNLHLPATGRDRILLEQGDVKLREGKYEEAEYFYLKCLNYHNMPEPKLRLSITRLRAGDPAGAHYWSVQQIRSTLHTLGATYPDPAEWAYLILTELCRGNSRDALKHATEFPELSHPELEWARFIADISAGRYSERPMPDESRRCHTIHQPLEQDFDAWLVSTHEMLAACGQRRFAERIRDYLQHTQEMYRLGDHSSPKPVEHRADTLSRAKPFNAPPHQRILRGVCRTAKRVARDVLHRCESHLGYVLPYRISAARSDQLFGALEQICRDEHFSNIVIVGASPSDYIAEACVSGSRQNRQPASIQCTSTAKRWNIQWRWKASGSTADVYYRNLWDIPEAIEEASLVVVAGADSLSTSNYRPISKASMIIVHDINHVAAYEFLSRMCSDGRYRLVDYNCEHPRGFAVFARNDVCEASAQLPTCE
jgi:hypothetical protein